MIAPAWLLGLLSVSFPGKAETMQVSISREDAHEAAVLVNSVVDSYLTDVVKAEEDQKRQRLSKLESACATKNNKSAIRDGVEEPGSKLWNFGFPTVTEVQKLMLGDYASPSRGGQEAI